MKATFFATLVVAFFALLVSWFSAVTFAEETAPTQTSEPITPSQPTISTPEVTPTPSTEKTQTVISPPKSEKTPEVKIPSDGKSGDVNDEGYNVDGDPSDLELVLPGATGVGVPNFMIDRFKVPPFLLPIYQAAGIEYGIPWQVLAAINEMETNYGRNLNVSSAGALGWMQFMPATWKQYGVDANNDGKKDPYNPVDAIFSAARYLKAAGGSKNMRKAIFAYNHADWYVDAVVLRAKLLGGLPDEFVGSLTGLTYGRFPVYAEARYASKTVKNGKGRKAKKGENPAYPVAGDPNRTYLDVYSREGAPVIAVNDGEIVKVGKDAQRGNFIELEDSYGNRYIYSNLGALSEQYLAPKSQKLSEEDIAKELKLSEKDPEPKQPASSSTYSKSSQKKAEAEDEQAQKALPTDSDRSSKQRLFADPKRSGAYKEGGSRQLLETGSPLPQDADTKRYFRGVYDLKREDTVLKQLRTGARVVGGTVLGTVGKAESGSQPSVRFEIKPAGKGSPKIDPTPIVDGWKLLESTAIYRAAGINPFVKDGKKRKAPTVGQIMLMSKERLEKLVLSDPRIEIYECGRRDIRAGIIDRRVLITLEFLAASDLHPTVSSLQCGHSFYTAGGGISHHTYGSAFDIAAINGVPINGNQGPGSVTEDTINQLLTLQGIMKPTQIISLMKFKGEKNTYVMGDHADHIHIGFEPLSSSNPKLKDRFESSLKPGQWQRLMRRLSQLDNPEVPTEPSRYAAEAEEQSSEVKKSN